MSARKEIRRIARDEGFTSINQFICFYTAFGYSLRDIHFHIRHVHKYYVSYQCLYSVTRAKAKRNFDHPRYLQGIYRRSLFNNRVNFRRVCADCENLFESNLSKPEISSILVDHGLSRNAVRGIFERRRHLKLKKKTKDGYRKVDAMKKWRKKLEELGYKDFKQAYTDLKKQRKSDTAICKVLGCPMTTLRYWIDKIGKK